MNKKAPHNLYQDAIIAHSQHPNHYHELKKFTHSAKGYNPVCGDDLTVYANVINGTFQDLSFVGDCCAVCKCSASLMADRLQKVNINEFKNILDQFTRLLQQKLNPDQDKHDLRDISILKGIWDYPSRIKCANLSWHALEAALNHQPQISTE